jgi:hypothetical protein
MATVRHRLAAACAVAWLVATCGSAAPASVEPTSTPSPPPPTATPVPTSSPAPTPTPAPTIPAYLDDLGRILAATTGVGSARIDYEIGFEGSSAAPDGPLMSGGGEFVVGDQTLARIDMDMTAAGLGRMEVIQDGDIFWMRSDAFKTLDPEGRWIRVDSTSDHPNAAAFSSSLTQQADPWAAMYYLMGATAPPETLEPDTIDGEPVRHLGLRLHMDAAVERAPADARDYLLVQAENVRQQGIAPVFDAEVWVDNADRIRRVAYRFDMSSLSGGGQMVTSYDLSDLGLEVSIEPPDPADAVDIEDLEFNPQ